MTTAQTPTPAPNRCARCGEPGRPGKLYCGAKCERAADADARRRAAVRLAAADPARSPLQRWLATADRRPPLTPEAEADLARRALAGDLAARNDLAEQYIPLIRKIAKRKHATQDATQTALLSLVLAAASYDPDHPYGRQHKQIRFGTYVGKVAHWRLAKWADAEYRRPVPVDPAEPDPDDNRIDLAALAAAEAADRAAEAADRAESAARRAEVAAAALAAMTPVQRAVMESWAAEVGRTAADVARDLGMTETKVYGYRRRAKAAQGEAPYAIAA